MYEDLKLKNKDIQFNDIGQLIIVEGKESITQSLTNRLNTIRGDLFYVLPYGMDIDFSKVKRLDRYKEQISHYIKDCLKDDLRLSGIAVVNLVKSGKDAFTVSLKVYLTDNTILDLNFTF